MFYDGDRSELKAGSEGSSTRRTSELMETPRELKGEDSSGNLATTAEGSAAEAGSTDGGSSARASASKLGTGAGRGDSGRSSKLGGVSDGKLSGGSSGLGAAPGATEKAHVSAFHSAVPFFGGRTRQALPWPPWPCCSNSPRLLAQTTALPFWS